MNGLEKAVKVFQKANSLAVDGVAGRVTWTRFFV
ncbi:peptidoglycan-binding protein [Bacillus sp. WMMC1349]|nr:peptidoglycan-binding protein [Bacillus sp. WMMC1349]